MLDLSFGNKSMAFPSEVKYSFFCASILLLLMALGILACQLHRYCTHVLQLQGTVNGSVCSGDTESTDTGTVISERHDLSFKVRDLQEEPRGLSRYLSSGSLLSEPGSVELDGLAEEQRQQQEEEEEQELSSGSLHFSLFYDQPRSLLVVTVLGAEGLCARDCGRSVQPFVRVQLLWRGPAASEWSADPCCILRDWHCRLVTDTSSPTLGDAFSCSLGEHELPGVTVRLEVRGFDKYSHHGILGEVRTPLEGLNILTPLEVHEDLQTPKKEQVGEMLLSLRYLPTSQRLELGLLKISTCSQSLNSDRALYARARVLCNRRKLRPQSTSLRPRQDVTVFNEVMTFKLPGQQVRECTITVSVYEVSTSKRSSKHLIGKANVGSSWDGEDEHWHLMMRSLRQPVAKWHSLYI